MNRIAVAKAFGGVDEAVKRSVGLIGGLGLTGDENVVIKPNICNSKNPGGMVITDFRIIESVVRMFRDKGNPVTLVESDNISGTAEQRADESGLLELVDRLGAEFMNLSKDNYEVHEVAGKKLRLPRTVMDADFFVNIPKIKTEGHVGVTLSIKNLFGVPQRRKKSTLHKHLNDILPYLAKMVRCDLIVVDGLICMEGNGPIIGTPRELGVVITGTNAVSVDAFCAIIMGFDPYKIEHIIRAHDMGVGEIDTEKIEVVGDDWEGLVCEFERPYSLKATLKSLKSIGKMYLT